MLRLGEGWQGAALAPEEGRGLKMRVDGPDEAWRAVRARTKGFSACWEVSHYGRQAGGLTFESALIPSVPTLNFSSPMV